MKIKYENHRKIFESTSKNVGCIIYEHEEEACQVLKHIEDVEVRREYT